MKGSFPWKRRGVPDAGHSYFINLLINFLTATVPFFSRLSHIPSVCQRVTLLFLPKTRSERSIMPGAFLCPRIYRVNIFSERTPVCFLDIRKNFNLLTVTIANKARSLTGNVRRTWRNQIVSCKCDFSLKFRLREGMLRVLRNCHGTSKSFNRSGSLLPKIKVESFSQCFFCRGKIVGSGFRDIV